MKSPQRNLFLAAIAALTATLSSSVVAQDTTATLPEDFPVSDYTLVEGNSYTSPTFGAWEVDTTVENRIVHAVLGPLTWANDTETDLVTLSTERWGALYTTFGTFEAAEDRPVTTAGLAIQNFPVVLSELDSGYYSIDNSGENPTPFFNHTKLDEEEGPIGAQAFIVYQINDFEGYFAGLVGKQSDMQSVLDGMYEMLAKLQSQNAYIGNSHIEEYYGNLVTDFETLHATYEDFVFFYHRLALTPYWVEAMGGTEENVASAQLYVNQLPLLEQAVLDIYKAAQVIRFENAEFLRTQLLGIISELEKAAAANPPSSGGSGGSSGGGGYVPPSTGGGSTTPIVVDGDAINWADVDQVGTTANQGIEGFNVSAQLNGVNPHIGNYYGPTGWYLDSALAVLRTGKVMTPMELVDSSRVTSGFLFHKATVVIGLQSLKAMATSPSTSQPVI